MTSSMSTRNAGLVLSFLCLVVGLLSGCSSESVAATQLLVVVNSDLALGSQLTAVEVEIQSADGAADKPDTRRFELSAVAGDGRYRLPLSFGVVRGAGGSNNIRVVVRGYGPGLDGLETVVVEQKSLVTFESETSQRLTVFLGGACFRVLCVNSEQSCYADGTGALGICTDLTEAQLERIAPGQELNGVVFLGDDAGTSSSDAGSDASTPPTPKSTLSVTLAGDGVGSVSASAGGIDCGATCSGAVDQGSAVTLTATAGEVSEFSGWSGGGCTGTDPCTVTVADATTVTATFIRTHYPLHINLGGLGVGVVTSGMAEISCGTDCDEAFPRGTTVELTASATPGTSFLGWSGGNCEGSTNCTVTMNGPLNILANFACTAAPGSQTFTFVAPGGPQDVSMKPACVRTITVDVQGAAGGYGRENESGTWVYSGYYGYGGRAQATLTLDANDKLTVFVGGRGGDGSESTQLAGVGGYNGGGAGSTAYGDRYAGGGGGASDIRVNWSAGASEADQLATRVVVGAGGGGGSPCNQRVGGIDGGSGGGLTGESPAAMCYGQLATPSVAPLPGTQSAGGAGGYWSSYGTAQAGSLGKGGSATGVSITSASGGGGGGYYGGGAGMWEAGAGGSSYVIGSATNVTLTGDYSYSGYVRISW